MDQATNIVAFNSPFGAHWSFITPDHDYIVSSPVCDGETTPRLLAIESWCIGDEDYNTGAGLDDLETNLQAPMNALMLAPPFWSEAKASLATDLQIEINDRTLSIALPSVDPETVTLAPFEDLVGEIRAVYAATQQVIKSLYGVGFSLGEHYRTKEADIALDRRLMRLLMALDKTLVQAYRVYGNDAFDPDSFVLLSAPLESHHLAS